MSFFERNQIGTSTCSAARSRLTNRTRSRCSLSDRRSSPCRRAATIVELLVVTSVISLLLALLLPAVISVRAASRRAACQNNFRQIGLALDNFEAAHQSYPNALCGVDWIDGQQRFRCGSPWAEMAGFLDGSATQSAIDAVRTPSRWDPSDLDIPSPVVLHCPEDSLANSRAASYRMNRGVLPLYPADPHGVFTGVFYRNFGRRPAEVTDGLSQTAFASERWVATISGVDRIRDPIVIPTVLVPELAEACIAANRNRTQLAPASSPPWGTNWLSGQLSHCTYYHFYPPNCTWRDCSNVEKTNYEISGSVMPSARGGHGQGVLVLFGDGHCEFASNDIDLSIWRAWGSRDGWELE